MKWWVSWYAPRELGGFHLLSPWWWSGFRDEDAVICAAIQADEEEWARDVILVSYDSKPADLEWRFVEQRSADWSPFSDRFPRAGWMIWS